MKNRNDKQKLLLKRLRTKAEELLAHAEPAKQPTSTIVVDKLQHELQVHQIELEMQNEELRRAQVALEASRNHFMDLYDFAPVGYVSLSMEGVINEINLTAAKLLGVERKKILNRHFAKFVSDEYKDLWYQHFIKAKRSCGMNHGCELPFHFDDGKTLYFHIAFLHIDKNDMQPVMHITLTDVTERKQIEKELRIAAVAFETQEGILVTDADKFILRVNQAFTRITGFTAEEVIGQKPFILRSGLYKEEFYQAMWATLESDRYWQGEIWNKRKNGEVYPVFQTISAVTDEDGVITHYVGVFTDITQRKQAEKVLYEARERLENQVATSQEELNKNKLETEEINTTLNFLLKYRESDKSDAKDALSSEVESTIMPFLNKLKATSAGRVQSTRLIGILESNLKQLVQSYGRNADLAAAFHLLTPVEAQVATLVRQGLSTKAIAATLNSSTGTVCIHRKRIRKKLGLDSKATNLRGHLLSLNE